MSSQRRGTTTGCTMPLPPTDSRSCRRRVLSPGLTFTRTRRGWRSTAMRSAPIRSSAGSVVDAVRVRRRARRESDRGVLRLRKYGVVARVIAATDAAPERPERPMATSRMLRVLAGSTALIVSPRPSTVFPDRTAVGVEAMPSHRHAAADADACPGRGGAERGVGGVALALRDASTDPPAAVIWTAVTPAAGACPSSTENPSASPARSRHWRSSSQRRTGCVPAGRGSRSCKNRPVTEAMARLTARPTRSARRRRPLSRARAECWS